MLALASVGTLRAIELATEGGTPLSVVISSKAGERTRQVANELADKLKTITTKPFVVTVGDGRTGIVLGTAADFPAISHDERLTSKAITDRENYLIRSEDHRLVLIGNTELAVEHAVWDLLHRLGWRQFFPGKTWEIIPHRHDLRIEVNRFESPAYHARNIWPGFGAISERRADIAAWNARNRATKGVELSSGHAYDHILHEHAKEFAAHPEMLALVKGQRRGPKFCISNPALRALVVADLVKKFDDDPALDSISCEPSDGGGWCECADCAKLGSVSDQALTLTNEVARALAAKHPGKIVGQYAYNEHSPAPSIHAEDNVVISIATGFIKGGLTMEQLMDAWSAKARTMGIREYYSVWPWDHDMPGQARGAQLDYLARTIPDFYGSGARYLSAEASDNWGCNGLGYYLASRLLWDPEQANNVDAIFDDFLDHAFGGAKVPMEKFYTLINRGRPPESDDLIGRMYRRLQEAGDLEIDDGTRARLDDLILYTHACELWLDYSAAHGAARQRAAEAMLRFAWQIRTTGMIHTMAMWRTIVRDKTVKLPDDCLWTIPEGKNPWKHSKAFTRDELDDLVEQGVAHRAIADFEPTTFSSELRPASSLKLTSAKPGNFGLMQRGNGSYWTWVDKAPAEIHVRLTAGLVYQNQGSAKVRLFPTAETQGASVSEGEVPPDKQAREIVLKTTFVGLHRIEVEDHRSGSKLEVLDGMPCTFNAAFDQTATIHGRYDLYFYVPRGTEAVGGFAEGAGRLLNGDGVRVMEFTSKPGYFKVPVAEGQDGRLWKFEFSSGKRVLLTVPPQMARSAVELLLPKEIVERDARAKK